MCIRDRFGDFVAVDGEIQVGLPSEFPGQVAGIERQLQSPVCLLYTSDAADERSSVDLGGRRIIKKKKLYDLQRDRRETHTHTKSQ